MLDLSQRLLRTIRKQDLLRPGDRVAVAVSGGADSVALLLLLVELRSDLGIVLSVAHVNHKLRGAESDEDQRFVKALAKAHGLEFDTVDAPVGAERGAGQRERGIEAAARELRFQFFRGLAHRGRASKIASAHTLDDQAETVLLRIFRGTGIRGLAGVHPHIALQADGTKVGEVVRPLLGFRRADLREFLSARGQGWREDSSNLDTKFSRNRVRQQLLPFISREFGDAALEHMAELAEIARAEEEWARAQEPDERTTKPNALDVEHLLRLPLAVQRRWVRAWLGTNSPDASISFRLIEEIIDLAQGPAGKKLELPGGTMQGKTEPAIVRRGRNELTLESESPLGDYQYSLPVPGAVEVTELNARFEATIVEAETVTPGDCEALIDLSRVGPELVIRNWRAGDRYWPAHTSGEKKVKELLGDRNATGSEKKLWPAAVSGSGELVWLRGFPAPSAWQARTGKAIWIRETRRTS